MLLNFLAQKDLLPSWIGTVLTPTIVAIVPTDVDVILYRISLTVAILAGTTTLFYTIAKWRKFMRNNKDKSSNKNLKK